jgi:hypothetical protein
VAATPFLNINNSAQTALHRIALLTDCQHPSEEHRIAIASDNTFSHYWAADAGAEEIPEKVRLSYVDPAKAATTSACSFLYKAKSLELVPKAIRDNFHLLEQSGQWYLFAKK